MNCNHVIPLTEFIFVVESFVQFMIIFLTNEDYTGHNFTEQILELTQSETNT
jgi:hypothetical protein